LKLQNYKFSDKVANFAENQTTMKTAYIFPGQGAQFKGMAKDLYENNANAKKMLEEANEILGFRITDIMFEGDEEALKATKVTQPAVFLHSAVLAACLPDFKPDMVAGHSLGEFSALAASGVLTFEDSLKLVSIRANAMQKACEAGPSTMAAIIGLPDEVVENVCSSINGVVVPANFNSPGQIVISGDCAAVDAACVILKECGARRALRLAVGGAFHSPLMEPARAELADGIKKTHFNEPVCPIYQNVTALPTQDPLVIKSNLLLQLTSPVRWTETVRHMIKDGAESFVELGPGSVLQGLVKRIADPDAGVEMCSVSSLV